MFGRYVACWIPLCLLAPATSVAAEAADPASEQDAAAELTAAQLYPLSQGAEWHYKMKSEKGDWEMSYQVAKLENQDDQEFYRVEMVLDGKIVLTEHLSQTPKGLYRNRYQDATLSPPLLLLKNPIEPGSQWTTKTQIGAQELTIDCQLAKEEVEVPAGKYDAVKLTVTTRADEAEIRSTYWFAKGVGIVRQEAEIGDRAKMSIELTKHQPGPAQ